jgi:hypothetical protein
MRDFELPLRVDDDPAGRDRGQRSTASLDEEMKEWDALWDDVTGAWEARQARWLARMREHAT